MSDVPEQSLTLARTTDKTDRKPRSLYGFWICTETRSEGGKRLLGPFASRDLAIEVRVYVEKVKAPQTFWVLHTSDREWPDHE